jgi:hypothetical protein
MSKLSPRKLTVEDFKDQQNWIGKLLSPMNDYFQQIYQGWNNGITVEDNLFREIRELKFTVDASTFPLRFKPKFASTPKGMNLIYCIDADGTDLTQVPCVNFRTNNGLIEITSIGGLTTGHTYTLRLEVIYG